VRDGEIFERWVKNRLFKEIPEGYTVLMDNARFHRETRLRKLARGKVRLLCVPLYSPDYNPIERTGEHMKRSLCNTLQNFKSVASAIYDYFNDLYRHPEISSAT
jgi:transposase